ncbi:MAG: malate dehydrogenase (quinone) [Crocinitomicaceae bacterium]
MTNSPKHYTLIGAGIMSATLGTLIKLLNPSAKISIYERLDSVGAESSAAWNNAGTGHSAFCELNYTPQREDGSIDMTKALKIAESFEISKQFWAYLIANKLIESKTPFINDIDHMSFVWGDENVKFLKKRYETYQQYAIFKDMLYSEDHHKISEWVPLIMENRNGSDKIAATKMAIGTDVNFGALTRGMIQHLKGAEGVELHLGHEIQDFEKLDSGQWQAGVKDLSDKEYFQFKTDFVFIGAGGGAIPLLEKTDLPQTKGYAGFPVSGQWLKCNNPDVIAKHEAKVYGMAETGSPPMSVPHLDTRMLDGKKSLLFGPYAGFSTKFLKFGSYFDLPLSLEVHNIWPLLSAGIKNFALTKYLVKQVIQSPEDRFDMLKKYYPDANFDDWELVQAGQRVQIIKKDENEGGVLKFGTEIVSDTDGSLAALLGASPGASTSVSIMIDVLKTCFPEQMETKEWQNKLREFIPTYGCSLIEDGDLCLATREATTRVLKLEEVN